MSEFGPQPNPERDREAGLAELVDQYFPQDKKFIQDMDFQEALGFVYGQLLTEGGDPDDILVEFGVIEREDGQNEV